MSALREMNIASDGTLDSRNTDSTLRETNTESGSAIDTRNKSAGEREAKVLMEKFGMSRPDDAELARRDLRNASYNGTCCYKCEHDFLAGEPIYRARTYLHIRGILRSWTVRMLSYCEECRPLEGYRKGECSSCTREVRFPFDCVRRRHVFCSDRCKRDFYAKRQRDKRLEHRKKVCDGCRERFTAARADAKFCSAACKQRAYRKRRASS